MSINSSKDIEQNITILERGDNMATLTPLRYPGSKDKTYEYIKHLVQINNCDTYIEPFVGGGSVPIKLLLNNDVKNIVINDYDKAIYAFWYSVINYTDKLIDLINSTDITIDEWHKQKMINKNKETNNDLLEIGFSTLFLNRTNRSGILKAGVIGGLNQSGNYKLNCRFNKEQIINKIKNLSKYKNRIKLYNKDAEEFIKQNITKTKNSLTFLDPPYYDKGPALYSTFYHRDDHRSLANTIRHSLRDKKWILTYDTVTEISNLYSEFRNVEYYLNYSAGKRTKGVEFMFFSENINIGEIDNYLTIKTPDL